MKKIIFALLLIAAVFSGFQISKAVPGALRRYESNKIINDYLQAHAIRKLQLGAGGVEMQGWLNTDIEPHPGEAYLDATMPFPFKDGSLHYIFGEHVIEHLTYDQGLFALRESHRVLAPGGKLRFATPDLRRLVALLDDPSNPYVRAKFAFHGWDPLPPAVAPVAIINSEMRNWGHQFVYDEQSLRDSLTRCGFVNIRKFDPGLSDDPNLTGVEMRHRNENVRAANDYESMVLQAERP